MTLSTTRVSIYARCSSEKQSGGAIEDQVRLCREYAERHKWTVVHVFSDISSSQPTGGRPGLTAMLKEARDIEVILAETLDRIGRDPEDVAAIVKHVELSDCNLVTISEGTIGGSQTGDQARGAPEKEGPENQSTEDTLDGKLGAKV